MPIRILIVDDHAVVRQGLALMLGTDPELQVVGEAENGEVALRRVAELQPQVVLMDMLMPLMDGVTATGHIRESHPETEVVALTSVLDDTTVLSAVKAASTPAPAGSFFSAGPSKSIMKAMPRSGDRM